MKFQKGCKHSEETKLKMSLNHADFSGKNNPMYGKPVSDKTKKKISEALKGRKLSEKHKRKIGESCRGKKRSEETKQKLREANTGKKNPMFGKHHSEGHKKKLSDALKKNGHTPPIYRKEKHWNWNGGVTPYHVKIRNNDEYKNWRKVVFGRDNYTCQKCKQVGGNMNAHHIKSFTDYPELIFDINNGITLCESCHKKIHKSIKKEEK